MKDIFYERIKQHELYIEKKESRIDNIVNSLTKEFKSIDSRLFVKKGSRFLSNISILICIDKKTISFTRELFMIKDGCKVIPAQYPYKKETNLNEIYDDVQLGDQDNDIELIKNMFKKYHSYGSLFKRIENELTKE